MSVDIATRAAPLYARIAAHIAQAIEAGLYPRGSMLPSEAALCDQFGVSRITLRAALKELQLRGMVQRRAGVGTRVEATMSQDQFVLESRTLDELVQFTDTLIVRLLDVEVVVCDPTLADRLECPAGTPMTRIRNLRVPERGPPVCLSEHYAPGLDPKIASAFEGRFGSLATMVERALGIPIESIRQSMDAERLVGKQAKLLKVENGEAALSRWRWYNGPRQQPLLISHSLFPRKRYSYTFTVLRRAGPPL